MVESQQRREKLKPLLNEVPAGFLVDAAWLVARKIDRKSILNYQRRGWLQKVARSVYRRPFSETENPDAKLGWKIPVLSMQRLLNCDIHVGGRTALSIQGFTHYLPLGDEERVFLYGKPPSWLKRLPDAARYEVRTRALFKGSKTGIDNADVSLANDATDNELSQSPWRWPLTVSSPERAILEMLNELPGHESFHIVDTVFEGLVNLRPKLLMSLLTQCQSVKVKRLFFVFADKHAHTWRNYVSPEEIDLGSGPRALIKGGRFHPHYGISVPEDFISSGDESADDGA